MGGLSDGGEVRAEFGGSVAELFHDGYITPDGGDGVADVVAGIAGIGVGIQRFDEHFLQPMSIGADQLNEVLFALVKTIRREKLLTVFINGRDVLVNQVFGQTKILRSLNDFITAERFAQI